MPSELWIDFETYSKIDLEKQGSMAYAKHKSTNVVCLGYAFDDEEPQLFLPHTTKGLDPRVLEHIQNGGKVFAHNMTFDFRIWNLVCTGMFEWPALSLDQCVDTMALCLTFQLPAKLAEAGAALNLPIQKNPEGKKLINKCCKPMANGKQPNPMGAFRAYFERLYAYCLQDIDAMRAIVRALPRDFLIPFEHEIWKLTYEINSRGVPVDITAIVAIKNYVEQYVKESMSRVPQITRGYANTINQIQKIKDWCGTQGYPLESLSAYSVDKGLKDPECPDNVKLILTLRQELGRSSTAKFKKLQNLAAKGPVKSYWVYDNIQYHGAGTGRWAGRGFQIHNLPRASVPDPEEEIRKFVTGEDVENPVYKAKALIRPMIKAPEGWLIMPSDYSSIENRVLHWLADDEETLDDFRNGLDQYCTMAAARYHLTYDEIRNGYKAKIEHCVSKRQMGKVIILGCLAESTLVLTQSGAKLIKDLCLTDKVWDGENWVGHSGSAYKGKKLCVSFNGVLLTKDHEVFVSDTKEEVWRHEGNTQSEAQAICLVIGKLLSSYQELSLLNETLATTSNARYAVLSLTKFWQDLKKVCQLNVVLAAEKPNISLAYQRIVSLQGSIKRLSIDLSTDGMPLKLDALYQAVVTTWTTEAEVFKCVKNGLSLLDLLLRMLWGYQDLTTPTSSSTELITTGTTLLATSGSAHVQKICLTGGPLSQRTEDVFHDTYDVLNAGPNNRFTVLTINGPMLVSNCGFGMGKDKFKDTADLQFGMIISEEESALAVKAYRARYPKVVELWKNLKNAAVKAVISGQRVQVGRITFATAKVKGRLWLAMQLPSGKSLYYPEPSVVQRYIPGYETMGKVPTVTHAGVNPKTKQWCRQALIPGRITENAVQGTAREAMAYGLMNVKNKMSYVRLLPSVHDESISLIKKEDCREGILDEYNYHLCDVPWADGLPLKAVGWIGNRYRKD